MNATEQARRSDALYYSTNDGISRRWLCNKVASLEAENAKLRELVRDMYFCNDETCTDCEHHDYSGEGFWCKRGVRWKKVRMRELGVKV